MLVCNVGGDLYAVEDVCPHDRGPLGEGRLRGATIECPRHGARFDVRDGSVKAPPAVRPVPCLPVHVEDGQVVVVAVGAPVPPIPPVTRTLRPQAGEGDEAGERSERAEFVREVRPGAAEGRA